MARELKNKTIVVTGGAQGIGFEIAFNFLKEGANLIILLDVDERKGKIAEIKLTKKYGAGKAIFFQCDVS